MLLYSSMSALLVSFFIMPRLYSITPQKRIALLMSDSKGKGCSNIATMILMTTKVTMHDKTFSNFFFYSLATNSSSFKIRGNLYLISTICSTKKALTLLLERERQTISKDLLFNSSHLHHYCTHLFQASLIPHVLRFRHRLLRRLQ